MKVIRSLFSILAAIALVILLFVAVEGRIGSNRQCYFVGECVYDEDKVGYRYYQCFGSYAAYSSLIQDTRCVYPEKMPRGVRRLFT